MANLNPCTIEPILREQTSFSAADGSTEHLSVTSEALKNITMTSNA